MSRQVVLVIETTGLTPAAGHRIIEIAGVELLDRHAPGKYFHRYLNPDRPIDPGAQEIHGMSLEMLTDKPRFADVAQEFTTFIRGASLIAHNAEFDLDFLDSELSALGLSSIQELCPVIIDTLQIARDRRGGQGNSLSALCRDYRIGLPKCDLHGAMLDAYMLAQVYWAMTRGLLN